MIDSIFNLVFRCSHSSLSHPITALNGAGKDNRERLLLRTAPGQTWRRRFLLRHSMNRKRPNSGRNTVVQTLNKLLDRFHEGVEREELKISIPDFLRVATALNEAQADEG